VSQTLRTIVNLAIIR